jgi:DNA polymerase
MMTTTSLTKLHIDIETYSEADLKKVGVYRYVTDPSFEILMMAFALDDDETEIIDLAQGEEIPEWLMKALVNPEILKIAHNANFERTCLQQELGVPMPPEQWYCTAVRASTLGLPRSLEEVGRVLGLESDKAKMKAGKQLIRYFSIPCKPTKRNGGRTRNLPRHEPEQWELYKKYCMRDVDAEREIEKKMEKYPEMIKEEHQLWCLDQYINEKGVLIQTELVNNILAYYETHQDALLDRAREISGLDNPKSISQSKEWLSDQGIETESLTKDTVKELIKETDDDDIQEFLEIRQQLGKTSVSKYDAIRRAINEDNRVRGILQFYGAERTGRWAGRIIQPQNLPKNKMGNLDLARNTIIENDFELLDILYGNPMQVFSELIRTAIIAPKGQTFIVADYSAIEARVIAWLANEKWRLDVFASHGKIYEASAAHMFKVPLESITKDSPERAKGKVAELALGYQGSVGALKAMGGEAMGLSEPEMKSLVDQWRNANANIVRFWYDTEENAKDAINQPGTIFYGPRGVEFQMIHDTLFIKLPNGRRLAYKNAKVQDGSYRSEIIYDGKDQNTGRWTKVNTYGGKLVENITQAVARDCLAAAMMELNKAGYMPTFHVHDEVIVEVPIDTKEKAMKDIKDLMALKLPWTKGLILTADAYDTPYYMKD